jgi:hypothetical protein
MTDAESVSNSSKRKRVAIETEGSAVATSANRKRKSRSSQSAGKAKEIRAQNRSRVRARWANAAAREARSDEAESSNAPMLGNCGIPSHPVSPDLVGHKHGQARSQLGPFPGIYSRQAADDYLTAVDSEHGFEEVSEDAENQIYERCCEQLSDEHLAQAACCVCDCWHEKRFTAQKLLSSCQALVATMRNRLCGLSEIPAT